MVTPWFVILAVNYCTCRRRRGDGGAIGPRPMSCCLESLPQPAWCGQVTPTSFTNSCPYCERMSEMRTSSPRSCLLGMLQLCLPGCRVTIAAHHLGVQSVPPPAIRKGSRLDCATYRRTPVSPPVQRICKFGNLVSVLQAHGSVGSLLPVVVGGLGRRMEL